MYLNQYEVLMDKVLQFFAGPQFKDEIQSAKREFFDNAGSLDEMSDQFELRMSQFFDWYFFTRPLKGFAQTPLESVHMARELRFSNEEIAQLEEMKKFRHSIFQFNKVKGEDIYLKDIYKNEKIIVKSSPWLIGFDEDELFEVRLVPYKDSFVFMRGFCFHPKAAKKFILSEMKKFRKDSDLNPADLMFRLYKMRYKFDQYRHVNLKMIYSNESRLGV